MTLEFKAGDKVRVTKRTTGFQTGGWVGVEGEYVKKLNGSHKVKLLTLPKDTWVGWKVGDVCTLGDNLELIEAAPPVFNTGDLVTFWDEDNEFWQGGLGKIVSSDPFFTKVPGYKVEVLEMIPLNDIQKVGIVVGVQAKNLKPVKKATWNSELGENSCTPVNACDACKEHKELEALATLKEVIAEEKAEAVQHPAHYGGENDPYEVIKVAEAWGFDKDAYLFNVLKYIARAGKKGTELQDHKKARFYIDRKIKNMEGAE